MFSYSQPLPSSNLAVAWEARAPVPQSLARWWYRDAPARLCRPLVARPCQARCAGERLRHGAHLSISRKQLRAPPLHQSTNPLPPHDFAPMILPSPPLLSSLSLIRTCFGFRVSAPPVPFVPSSDSSPIPATPSPPSDPNLNPNLNLAPAHHQSPPIPASTPDLGRFRRARRDAHPRDVPAKTALGRSRDRRVHTRKQ